MSTRCAPWLSSALLSDLLIALLIDLNCGLPALAQEAARPDPVLERCLVSLRMRTPVPIDTAPILV